MAVWDDVIPQEEQALYERGGWGGRVGFGRRPALLVVDMYTAFVDPAYPYSSPGAPATVRAIQTVLAAARTAGCPVFFSKARRRTIPAERGRWKVTANRQPIMSDPAAYEIVSELRPLESESVLVKSAPSAFWGTDLASYLIYHRVDTVIVTGTVTSGCVRDTVLDAFNYSFRAIVPEECVCDRGLTSHKVTLFDIHMKYGDVVPTADVLEYLKAVRQGEHERPVGAPSHR
ncbi:MAG TPA: isochorismatase family protein [bacterium]|nr:isochorismatase family protein [bacterium]